MFMWGFGWEGFADRGAAGAARHCFLALRFLPCRFDYKNRKFWAFLLVTRTKKQKKKNMNTKKVSVLMGVFSKRFFGSFL